MSSQLTNFPLNPFFPFHSLFFIQTLPSPKLTSFPPHSTLSCQPRPSFVRPPLLLCLPHHSLPQAPPNSRPPLSPTPSRLPPSPTPLHTPPLPVSSPVPLLVHYRRPSVIKASPVRKSPSPHTLFLYLCLLLYFPSLEKINRHHPPCSRSSHKPPSSPSPSCPTSPASPTHPLNILYFNACTVVSSYL